LPLKVLVWQQNDGVWLAYNDIGHIALRHGATKTPGPGRESSGALQSLKQNCKTMHQNGSRKYGESGEVHFLHVNSTKMP
jgi:hypothetical protein